MTVTAKQTIKDVAGSSLDALRILQDYGLDFCRGAGHTLEEACGERDLPLGELIDKLNRAGGSGPSEATDWRMASLDRVIAHILVSHHGYLRRELPRLEQWMERVNTTHGARNPERFRPLTGAFYSFRLGLECHLHTEETDVFPLIAQLARKEHGQADTSDRAVLYDRMDAVEREHTDKLELLRTMRSATDDYSLPPNACIGYRTLFLGLQELEENVRRQIYFESEILFTRARKL